MNAIVAAGWKLVDVESGVLVLAGEKRKDFRGDDLTMLGGEPPSGAGKVGYVYTDQGRFYASVVSARWVRTRG